MRAHKRGSNVRPSLPDIPDIVHSTSSYDQSKPSSNEYHRTSGTFISSKQDACVLFYESLGRTKDSRYSQESLRRKQERRHFTSSDSFLWSNNWPVKRDVDSSGCMRKLYDPQNKSVRLYGTTFSPAFIHDTDAKLANINANKSKRSSATLSYQTDKTNNCFGQYKNQNNNNNNDNHKPHDLQQVNVSDIIGSFGLFQLLVLLFSGLRECLVGYDALIMSVILQPEARYLCADNLVELAKQDYNHTQSMESFNSILQEENKLYHNNYSISSLADNLEADSSAQCFKSLDGGRTPLVDVHSGEPIPCKSWIFANTTAETGPSLVAEWSLVCQYHWFVAFIESAYFFGLVTGNLTWGFCADKFGRRPAYLVAHAISLVFGSLAIVAPTIHLFALCRFLSAFGSIGYNIIYSIQVEIIGARHRSFSTILNHLGWGLGVICVPLVDHLFDDYRPIIAIAPMFSLIMLPWAFWLPESSRWLMANDRYDEARHELIRAARFNGKVISQQLEKKISSLEQRSRCDKIVSAHIDQTNNDQDSKTNDVPSSTISKRPYKLIFSDPKLLRDTLILSYLAFLGHLFYYVQTINFAYMKNLSTEANFIISGAGEWVSVVVGAILLKLFTRKTCMSLFLFIMACSFAFQSLIESDAASHLDTTLVITTNNALGTLSSLLLIFVALIVNQEVYPTVVRQTGTSITNTLGESGSTLAPMLIQFSRIIGAWQANLIYAIVTLFGICAAQLVTPTDDIELPDN